MPHTILEYSANLPGAEELRPLWQKLHPALAATAPCRIQDIKSRAYPCDPFWVGDGDPGNSFAHLTIRMLEGRAPENLARVGEAALGVLMEHFAEAWRGGRCALTVELAGMRKDSYFKAIQT